MAAWSSSSLLIPIVFLAWATFYLYRQVTSSLRSLPLPPGPKPLPFLGNLFDIPSSREYETYTRWGKEYGDVVHVSALGQHIIILNSIEAVNELLEQRSIIYSDRPYVPMFHEESLTDSGWSFAFKRYSSAWRRQRRLFVQYLNPTVAPSFFTKQTATAHKLLRSLLHSPSEYVAHIRHSAADTIMGIAYGYDLEPENDPFVELAEKFANTVLQCVSPGAYMVNSFPWLRYIPSWFPGAGFKAMAKKGKELGQNLVRLPFENLKMRMAQGTAPPSFAASALADISNDSPPHMITDIQEVAAVMYGAATDTTVACLHSCILGLILNPSVQHRAQAELDTVLGAPTSSSFVLPTFDDRSRLPYLEAVMKESLRWMTTVASGVPHATTEEDVYRGWRIPKGTIVIPNAWGLLHDDKIYPNPNVFRPERFLDSEGADAEPDPGLFGAFGFGRRACPGRHLAEASLWIEIASLLSVFTFSLAKDKTGQVVDVTYAATPVSGTISHPQFFPCSITPRSSEAEARICETDPHGVL